MKWTLFLLALVVGLALAAKEEEKSHNAVEEKSDPPENRALDPLSLLKKTILGPFLAPAKVIFNIAMEVVTAIALILLIAQLVKELDLKSLLEGTGTASGYESGYGYPAAVSTGYNSYGGSASGGSSYTSTGHSARSSHAKRAAVDNSFFNLPVVQRLTARVTEAIDNFNP